MASGTRTSSTSAISTSLVACLLVGLIWSHVDFVTCSAAVGKQPPDRGSVGFAGAAHRELGQGREPPRQGVIRKHAAQAAAQIVKRRGRSALGDDNCGTDDLAPLRVGTSYHDGLGDSVELGECCFDQSRNHLETAGVDQVVEASVDDQGALVEMAGVVGAKP